MDFEKIHGLVRGVLTEHLLAILKGIEERKEPEGFIVLVVVTKSGTGVAKVECNPVTCLTSHPAILRDIRQLPVKHDRQLSVLVSWIGGGTYAFAWQPGLMYDGDATTAADDRIFANRKVFAQGTPWFEGWCKLRRDSPSKFAQLFDSHPVTAPLGQYRMRSESWVIQQGFTFNKPLMLQLVLLNRCHGFAPGYDQTDSVFDRTDLAGSMVPEKSKIILVLQRLLPPPGDAKSNTAAAAKEKEHEEDTNSSSNNNKTLDMSELWEKYIHSPHWGPGANITSVLLADGKSGGDHKKAGTDLAYRAFKGDMVTGMMVVQHVEIPKSVDRSLFGPGTGFATQIDRVFVAPGVLDRDGMLQGLLKIAEQIAQDEQSQCLAVLKPKVAHTSDADTYDALFAAKQGFHKVQDNHPSIFAFKKMTVAASASAAAGPASKS